MSANPITTFIKHHYRHFNAAAMLDAGEAYRKHVEGGGHMLLALAGAMSTAELGLSLAEMIRRGKVHAISCTGANLEEDVFNLVAHDHYVRIPNYRDLTPKDEEGLLARHLNRVTDTCIPEEEAMRRIEAPSGSTGWRTTRRANAPSRTSTSSGCCSRGSSSPSTRSIRRTAG
jgi:deoxyhypusine synthase